MYQAMAFSTITAMPSVKKMQKIFEKKLISGREILPSTGERQNTESSWLFLHLFFKSALKLILLTFD
jgi:hypothetical protein